jgi:hypothetical protein
LHAAGVLLELAGIQSVVLISIDFLKILPHVARQLVAAKLLVAVAVVSLDKSFRFALKLAQVTAPLRPLALVGLILLSQGAVVSTGLALRAGTFPLGIVLIILLCRRKRGKRTHNSQHGGPQNKSMPHHPPPQE